MSSITFHQEATNRYLTEELQRQRPQLAERKGINRIHSVVMQSLRTGVCLLRDSENETILVGRVTREQLELLRAFQEDLTEVESDLWREIIATVANPVPHMQAQVKMESIVVTSILEEYDPWSPNELISELKANHHLLDLIPGERVDDKQALWVLIDGETRDEDYEVIIKKLRETYFLKKMQSATFFVLELEDTIQTLMDEGVIGERALYDKLSEKQRNEIKSRLLFDNGMACFVIDKLAADLSSMRWTTIRRLCRRICPEAWNNF